MKIIIETDTERVELETFYKEKKLKIQLPIDIKEVSIKKSRESILSQTGPIDIKEIPIKKSKSINYEMAKETILSQNGEFMFIDIRDTLQGMPVGSIGNALRFLYKHGRVQKVGTIRGKSRWKVIPEPKIGDIAREDRKNIIATIKS